MERTIRFDDLDPTQTADETIRFSVDDDYRTIDLSAENAEAFYKLLEPYLNASQPFSPTKVTTKPSMSREERQAITEWAKTVGIEIAPRGRIASDVVDRYHASLKTIEEPAPEPVEPPVTEPEVEQAPTSPARTRRR